MWNDAEKLEGGEWRSEWEVSGLDYGFKKFCSKEEEKEGRS